MLQQLGIVLTPTVFPRIMNKKGGVESYICNKKRIVTGVFGAKTETACCWWGCNFALW